VDVKHSSGDHDLIPAHRVRYLAEIAETIRAYHAPTERLADAADRLQHLAAVAADLAAHHRARGPTAQARSELDPWVVQQLETWPEVVASYADAHRETLSGNRIPRVALPRFRSWGDLVRFWRRENLPGRFPFTAGVFPFKREDEDPARMFAGEGDPFRTNRRFRMLSEGQPATRLSTAFDSVTLYGRDPDERPDIYGKIGTSGVSVATLDDMKVLYDGFDLLDPTTSVSMTINGPAP